MDWITGITLVLVALISPGDCRSTGAPVEACATLVPQHGSNVNSTDTLPYELVVDIFEDPGLPQTDGSVLKTYSYNPGTTYNLILRVLPTFEDRSQDGFRGFFVQAKLIANDSNVEGFQYPSTNDSYRLSSCPTPTVGVTQNNNRTKSSVTIAWTAPPADTGPLQFRFSFVENYTTFWAHLNSVPLIERTCPVQTGLPYYHPVTGQCIQQCPPGYIGSYANSAVCQLYNSTMDFTVDVYYIALNQTLLFENAVVMNFTLMLRRSVDIDNNLFSTSINLLSTEITERNFRFANGHLQGFLGPEEQINLNEKFSYFTGTIHIININNLFSTSGDFRISLNLFSYGIEFLFYSANIQVLYTINRGPCYYNPCMSGICFELSNHKNDYNCSCYPDYSGSQCNQTIDDCRIPYAVNCNNGYCVDGNETFNCSCYAGFMGKRCEVNIDECEHNQCLNGICNDTINHYNCDCYPGWSGRYCETRIDYCDGDESALGSCNSIGSANCTNLNSTFLCTCHTGWTGVQCDVDIDECESKPCVNGGCCTNGLFGNITCTCQLGYSGITCEDDNSSYVACSHSSCLNGGTCVEDFGPHYHCDCDTGYGGANCSFNIDYCNLHICQNGATCVQHTGTNFSCICSEGYTGYICDTRLTMSYRNESCSKCMESIEVTTANQVTDLQQTLKNTTIIIILLAALNFLLVVILGGILMKALVPRYFNHKRISNLQPEADNVPLQDMALENDLEKITDDV